MKIILSRTNRIGDVLTAIPAFFMVRKMYPDADITVMVRNYTKELVSTLPYINSIISIEDYTEEELHTKIAEIKPDIFVALYNDLFICKAAKASGARIKISKFITSDIKLNIMSLWTYNRGTYLLRRWVKKHEVEHNLELVRLIDKKLYDSNFEINKEIYLNENDIEKVNSFIATQNWQQKKLIGISPVLFSSRSISEDDYVKVINRIADSFENIQCIIFIDPDNKNKMTKLSNIKKNNVFYMINTEGLLYLAAFISKLTAFIAPSTGPIHIAGALNIPTIGLYAETYIRSPFVWGCYNNPNASYICMKETGSMLDFTKEHEERLFSELERLI